MGIYKKLKRYFCSHKNQQALTSLADFQKQEIDGHYVEFKCKKCGCITRVQVPSGKISRRWDD